MRVLIAWIFIFHLSYLYAKPIVIKTGELPPYSYHDDGGVAQGVAFKIVEALLDELNINSAISFYPWARAIKISQNKTSLTFPVARLPYREELYQWVGPILSDDFVFVALANTPLEEVLEPGITDFKDKSVAVNHNAPTEKRLQMLAFSNIDTNPSEKQSAKKLLRNRIEYWYSSRLMVRHTLMLLGADINEVSVAYSDLKIDQYLAFSKDVEASVITRWQKALDTIQADGRYQEILLIHGVTTSKY